MKRLLVLGFAVLFATPTLARAQTIRGAVVEDGAGTPIAGVLVEVRHGDGAALATALTDELGRFVLQPGRAGSLLITLRHVGYATVESIPFEARAGEAHQVELRMGRTAIPVEPIVVFVRRDARLAGFHMRAQRPGAGQFIMRAEIEQRRSARPTELLFGLRGVELIPSPQGNIVTMQRALGRCLPAVYLDGMPIGQLDPIDRLLMTSSLEGVEVYSGQSAPAQFRMSTCGVIAFWTQQPEGARGWSWRRFAAGASFFTAAFLLRTR